MKTTALPPSVLTKNQAKSFGPRPCPSWGEGCMIRANVRFDDQCGNGHNTFSITADISSPKCRDEGGGCCHEEIAEAFPELAPFVKWHLVSTDGPMHYVANTVYHAESHPANMAWLYFEDSKPEIRRQCMGYDSLSTLEAKAKTDARFSVEADPKTAKEANLAFARSSAVWPEATDEELMQEPEALKAALLARLPALLVEFKAAVESLGFTY